MTTRRMPDRAEPAPPPGEQWAEAIIATAALVIALLVLVLA